MSDAANAAIAARAAVGDDNVEVVVTVVARRRRRARRVIRGRCGRGRERLVELDSEPPARPERLDRADEPHARKPRSRAPRGRTDVSACGR